MPSALADAEVAAAPSALRAVLASPLYRGATIALFLSGLGVSAAAPQITLFLVDDLHTSLTTAGLYYLTNITAPLAGYLIGTRSDRTGKRLGLFRICAVAAFLGWTAMAFSTQVWMPFVISSLILAFSGAAGSQLFAAVHDSLQETAGAAGDGVVSVIRMALTAGWIIGPVLGSLLTATAGPRVMLVCTGICALAQIVPMGFARTTEPGNAPATSATTTTPAHAPAPAPPRVHHKRPGLSAMLPLLAFTGLYICVYAGEPIKYGYLTIYMRTDIHLGTAVSGAVIAIQPLIELILMPVAVLTARRIGMMRLMVFGAGCGVGANLCFALTGDTIGMFAGQILMGCVWGVFAALGIIVAQRLLPEAVATASAIFMSSPALASAVGGVTGGIGVDLLGLPHVFLAPAVYGVIATIGFTVMSRSRHTVR
ncbi:MFS transporter [Catenulispora sp. NF23]|uniref:MFS transporter n=1 Tax=Catenulispora pinistramenti TaxID=2705254 RepID=UPI001BA7B40A|nr:MFS transporter [Catenulispora pinistramenti]MBS2534927.1 MFS transporter [Catenulispora pinistramenti]